MRSLKVIAAIVVIFTALSAYFLVTGKTSAPPPVRIMNLSAFDSPEQIGAVTFRRFWVENHRAKVIVLASSAYVRDYERVWMGYLSVARENQFQFSPARTFEQSVLRPLVAGSQPLDWSRVHESIASLQDDNEADKVLIHVVATDEMWGQVKRELPGALVIFQNLLPLTEAAKNILTHGCLPLPEASMSTPKKTQIHCAALQALTYVHRKAELPREAWVGFIEQEDPLKYLLLLREPQ